MKTFTVFLVIICTQAQQAFAQLTDDFSDGNFSSSPGWSGTDSKFTVSTSRLKLQAPVVTADAYLSTPSASISNATWEFFIRMEFNPSSTNYARVYLVSDNADLSGSLNGYFIGIGNSSDEISLYKQTGTTATEIIDGVNDRLNISIVEAKIKVTRDSVGKWELYTNVGLTPSYSYDSSAVDTTHFQSKYFGVYCNYTSTRSDKFYFDDFTVTGDAFVDVIAPSLQSVSVMSSNQLQLTFSEELNETAAENVMNFEVTSFGTPTTSVLEPDLKNVILEFASSFPNGVESTLSVSGMVDTAGNVSGLSSKKFLFFQASPVSYRDLIFTEIFADFSPTIGLPEAEFIEIYNRSANPIDLQNWKVTDGSSTGTLSSKIILPGAYIILSSNSSSTQFAAFGETLSLSNFPTLNNSSDILKLIDNTNQVIDSLNYTDDWYKDDDKKLGGWTLELIDPEDICKGEDNWAASIDSVGGTPGKINSIDQDLTDTEGPKLTQALQVSNDTIELVFNEKLNGTTPALTSFHIEPEVAIADVFYADATLKKIRLALNTLIQDGRTYQIFSENIYDCPGNLMDEAFGMVYLNLDTVAPVIDSIKVISSTSIQINFSENIIQTDAEDVANYTVASIHPASAILFENNKTVTVTFSAEFPNGAEQMLKLKDIADINGNMIIDSATFIFFEPSLVAYRDIIITEIFSDPSPVIGLPEAEFAELHNRSANPIDLNDWQFTDGSSVATLPNTIILPGEYVIVTSSSFFSQFSVFGKTLAVANFPTLNNSGDALVLRNSNGDKIDSVKYSNTWFNDDDKKEGGWTLELIDPENTCKGSANWTASTDSLVGGTPGAPNSVHEHLIDLSGPMLMLAEERDSVTVQLTFNEKLNSTMPLKESVTIIPAISIDSISFADETLSTLLIHFADELFSGKEYQLTVNNIADCPGNLISPLHANVILNADTLAPRITNINLLSATEIEITFSEELDTTTTDDTLNYQITNTLAYPKSAGIADNNKTITLDFLHEFENGIEYNILIQNLSDINGNKIEKITIPVLYFEPMPTYANDVIITEIFADPSPVIGLPEAEFVEIFNRSENPIQIKGWTLTDGTSVAHLPMHIMLPGEYVILSATSSAAQFHSFGKSVGVQNFPSLNNSADALVLRNAEEILIDSVNYSESWYLDEDLKNGGASLELIDPENVCAEETNWAACEDEKGGTPGKQNSIFANKPDLTGPKLLMALPVSNTVVRLHFDEKLQAVTPRPEDFTINLQKPSVVEFADQSLRSLDVHIDPGLIVATLYTITANSVSDCSGNEIQGNYNSASFALPEEPSPGEIVINEILFNPMPTGVDFVEVFNNSTKFIDLKNLFFANLEDGMPTNQKSISDVGHLLAPKTYAVFTTNVDVLKTEYPPTQERIFIEMESLPSMNDDEGTIAITDTLGNIIDAFAYSDKMHSVFLKDDEGVSLERVDLTAPTNSAENWKSASELSGFATPGYVNSNSVPEFRISDQAVLVDPQVFQPMAGGPDFTRINYNFEKGGFVANVKIFDPQGRTIKQLVSNEILGTEGFFRWDGDEDNGSKARVGCYMIWFEIFDETGNVQVFKKPVVIATKF